MVGRGGGIEALRSTGHGGRPVADGGAPGPLRGGGRGKEVRMPVTSSTADDIGILAERGGDRRGFLAEGFTCGDPEFGAAVAAVVARPLAVFQQVEAGLRLAAIGSATATTS